MNPTKKQLVDFICLNFADSEENHPVAAQLDSYKKDDLIKLITDADVEKELETYINSLS